MIVASTAILLRGAIFASGATHHVEAAGDVVRLVWRRIIVHRGVAVPRSHEVLVVAPDVLVIVHESRVQGSEVLKRADVESSAAAMASARAHDEPRAVQGAGWWRW